MSKPISPLRRRMIEDMTIRRFKPGTRDLYLRAVAKFAQHFSRSPDQLDFEHVRRYQLHLVQSGFQAGYIRQTMTALRFFYKVTLGRPDAPLLIPLKREPAKLRDVLLWYDGRPPAERQIESARALRRLRAREL